MIYLDNSATSRFKPQSVIDAWVNESIISSNPGRSGHDDSFNAGMKIYHARNTIRDLLNIDASYEIIYTSNCSEALNLAIFGLLRDKKDKPHIISTMREHNSVLRPLHKLENDGTIELTIVTPNEYGIIDANIIESAIKSNTMMVAINHTSNVTGSTCDIAEIGKITRKNKIYLLADCAQSLGHIKVDMDNFGIDILAGAGHKGLHGPQGIGFLAFKRDIPIQPLKFGGTGTDSQSLLQPIILPESLECGTLNTSGILSLDAGIKWTMENFDNLHHIYRYLASELLYGLRQISGVKLYSSYPSNVISFNVSDISSSDTADFLNSEGIAVRSGLHCAPLMHKYLGTFEQGTVRASLGYNNTITDIKKILIAIEKIAKTV